MRNPPPRCRYCEQRHDADRMCAPARRILDAMVDRGMSFNMPTVEFPEPLPADELGLGMRPGDALVQQLVVEAATVQFAGVLRPMVILTGRSVHGGTLARWFYAGDADDMARLRALINDTTEMAVRAAGTADRADPKGDDPS
jgi:hypothetical protein